jgi:hypothetical protein
VTDDEKFSLASAQHAADVGRLDEWVVDFLASPGSSNSELAAAFALSGATYVGPIRFPLDRLTPMAGPVGDEVVVPVPEEAWESEVEAMEHSIERGWHPRRCWCRITTASTALRTEIIVMRHCAEWGPRTSG